MERGHQERPPQQPATPEQLERVYNALAMLTPKFVMPVEYQEQR